MRMDGTWLGRIWKPDGFMPTKLMNTMAATVSTKISAATARLSSRYFRKEEDDSVRRLRFFGKALRSHALNCSATGIGIGRPHCGKIQRSSSISWASEGGG